MRNKWLGRKVKVTSDKRLHDAGVICGTSKYNIHVKFPDGTYEWFSLGEVHVSTK